jgi:small-conductance mechanosensitive channel
MEQISNMVEPIINFLPKIPLLIIYVLLAYIAIEIIIWVLEKIIALTHLPKLKGIILSLTKLSLWVVFVILISNTFGFNRLAVAISGTALVLVFFLNTGLAPLITDAISGIFLSTDPDFLVGSKVRIGKGEQATEGIIKEIDMRKVRIKSADGNVHVIPNSVIDKDEWVVIEKTENVLKKRALIAREVIKNKIQSKTLKNS